MLKLKTILSQRKIVNSAYKYTNEWFAQLAYIKLKWT